MPESLPFASAWRNVFWQGTSGHAAISWWTRDFCTFPLATTGIVADSMQLFGDQHRPFIPRRRKYRLIFRHSER